MHIPDGFLSNGINIAGYAASGLTAAVAVKSASRTLGDRQAPLLGVTAAFVFAAQMINFPVAAGTSGHFLGAVLAALLLGPLNAFLVLLIVLTVQCLGFADGGLTALGTNIFNMGVIGGIVGYGVFAALRAVLPKNRAGFLAAVAPAAWLSVMLGAAACSFELAASGTIPLKAALIAMLGVHTLIGIGEAIITTAVVSLVLSVRPDLVAAWRGAQAASTGDA